MTLNQIELLEKQIIEHQGYCEVPSATDTNKSYRVYTNSKLYSVSCNCKAGQCGQDCGHRVAVDRHFDDRRNAPKPVQPVVLWSNVCGHRVKFDVDSHCGCMA